MRPTHSVHSHSPTPTPTHSLTHSPTQSARDTLQNIELLIPEDYLAFNINDVIVSTIRITWNRVESSRVRVGVGRQAVSRQSVLPSASFVRWRSFVHTE